ncbi:MAG: fimbrillin family protein [Bacteroidales bacterium]|jgi:uncharacterized protein (TIGR02145 family)|nr:fimbrillin family protein [Bacteroidales bacterium]MCI1784902.1 fimbrillin family protein [Bacteroidales bacterium]
MKKFLLVLAVVALAACSKDNGTKSPQSKVIIEPIITRATDVDFESGDEIGLSVIRNTGSYADNIKMTYDGTVFSGALTWYAEANDSSSLFAYYPYSSTGVPSSFTVAADQTSGISSSDFMASSKSPVYPSANAVAMVFKHQLTKIVVKLKNETGASITNVVLKNSIPAATINSDDYSATVDNTVAASDISLQKVADTVYQAILVPQTVALKVAVTVAGKTLSQNLVSIDLKSGGQYSVNVRVLSDNLSVSASGDIENWTDEGGIGSDNSVPFEEFDDHFVYDGVSYRTVTLGDGRKWMADPMRYVPNGMSISDDPTDDSGIWYPYTVNSGTAIPATDEATISKLGYLYDYAAAFESDVTVENYDTFDGARGICPEGWHIPTRAEFVAVCGSSVKSATESAAVVDPTAAYYHSDYNGARITSLDTAGFHFSFSGLMMKNSLTTTGRYLATLCTTSNSVEAYIGNLSMNYLIASTPYKLVYSSTDPTELKNIQYFGMMSTFTSTYKEGRLSVAYTNYKSGYQLRCIKDKS